MQRQVSFVISFLCIALFNNAFSQTQSDLNLHRLNIYTPATQKLTKLYTTTEWGVQLFENSRNSILQYFTWNPYQGFESSTTFHLDHAWNRFVYEEYGTNWVRAHCGRGSGDNQLMFPKSFDVVSYCDPFTMGYWYGIYVLDTGNDRLMKFRYYYQTEEVVQQYSIAVPFVQTLTDISVYNGGTHSWQWDDYLMILDGFHIRRFEETGAPNAPAYGVYGCSGAEGEFCQPTALVCGRSYIPEEEYDDPNADNNYLYVADPGNDRIVWLEINYVPGMYPVTWLGEVSLEGRHIVDLEVDNYGQVWAVDRDNGCLIKYTYDLTPLCTYGTTGAGEHQFYWPLSASCAGGYWGGGNLMVTESWSDSSGVQFFDIGTDVINLSSQNSDNNHWSYLSYTLTDPSRVTVKVYNNLGIPVKTIREGMETSGESCYIWDGTYNTGEMVPTGLYYFLIADTSSYTNLETGEPAYTVLKTSDTFFHEYNPYSNYTPGDVNDDGSVNAGDMVYIINYIFKYGPAPEPNLCVGDVNGDQSVNIGDAVYLNAYIFQYGPPPSDGCQTWPE